MSEQTSQEPTMEEILASIRRIISEDDAPAPEEAEAAPALADKPIALKADPEPANEPTPHVARVEPEPEVEEEALELTEKVETHGDLDVVSPAAATHSFEPEPLHSLVSERAASAAASSFGQLSAAIGMPKTDRTLEDVVREMLRPMLQQWLDENLPDIVQQTVESEVERIARGRAR
ncbi:MAG TPA: DUF2497 domain-containing protein [Phenylobacterium sp.]|nr:DUF2497 domain-containing protein [Phenylobacterium sp.]